ncbi:Homeobox-leucine zipper protein HOX6 [Hibiscus syriacus]|uniref:Homeobox-leucine zipper protein n=1 Tax=Hibiscus syriacus TaxID=106335 RepID=A0A6A3CEK4_HIBSY|nr:homeobox-leucine zipper protein ATHB-12-like [Hibiscus syriacus]KAE8726131.1 Homeobox-leucine zipper protein HOX6 [Hibiscus syriacus]
MNNQRFPSDYSSQEIMEDHPFCTMTEVTTTTKRKQKKNKRRFSDDQIRSLESIFESESRLDPPKKVQVAKDLGLQQRQVAIWFQNKRARRKSKQLERDYNNLLQNYNNLDSLFEGLKKEKQDLLSQLQKLKDLRKKPKEEKQCCGQVNSYEGDAVKSESEEQRSFSMERSEHALEVLSDDDSAIMTGYFRLEEEPQLISMVEPAAGALTSPDDWQSFESDALFDQSGCGYQWWDFWS